MNGFVDFCQEETCFVTQKQVDEWQQKALSNSLKKYRFCLHQDPESSLHEMIIVTTKYDLKYPDKHMETTESNIILRGKLLVILFSENGEIQKAFTLEPEGLFYYRCKKNQYHMTIPLTEMAVYIEIKEGPFDENTNVFPNWAPDRNNQDSMRSFNEDVKRQAMKFIEKG